MNYEIISDYSTVVIGSGAAGFAAACRIMEAGKKSVCMITEGVKLGTSRNTGSDKQTYYKLGLAGDAPDSVRSMAETFFSGGCVDGDNALCEAALSARCFSYLCEAGVPFPHNAYGEYVGYKTDHDPFARATSAGPLTSKFMTEALEKRAAALGLRIFDGLYAIRILKDGDSVCGVLSVRVDSGEVVVFKCQNIVLATGGPAGIYKDSVYPDGHFGSTGLALRAGVSLQNMTEWQYGLASVMPKWNVSGTYMQVLPRLISVDRDGVEREFLLDYFSNAYEALSMLFMKGYQWPFDAKKAESGSSRIDIIVYLETVVKGRKVYLDYTKNPFGFDEIDFEKLSGEAFSYLSGAEACFGTPIQRLAKMNSPAIELYRSKGVDLEKEYLQIALCAQHNNGGISVDADWQTSLSGLYAVGECAGTHGVTRPGGSALNAGQVGALRAASHISMTDREDCSPERFKAITDVAVKEHGDLISKAVREGSISAEEGLADAQEKMSSCAAAIRIPDEMRAYSVLFRLWIDKFSSRFSVGSRAEAFKLYRLRDALTVQLATLTAMIDYAEKVGVSRGSALYMEKAPDSFDGFTASVEGVQSTFGEIRTVSFDDGKVVVNTRPVRPMPPADTVFETVWREYRERNGINK